jgi:Transposase DDE domain
VQTAVTEQQIILAAEISLTAADFGHLEPMLDRALAHLSRHGITEQPEAVVGEAGYWHTQQIQAIADRGIEVLVPPDGAAREGKRPGWENGLFEQMRERLRTDRGRAFYALRKITIEPVFGQVKYNRRVDRFMRRGRGAVHSELRLVAATHNLHKLHNHWIANNT